MTPGATLGPYRLVAELGSGGMGTVWKAQGPEGVVALKVVHPHVAATPGFLERFLREGELGRRVRHENVVATLAAGSADGRHWIALEYVEGRTLRALAEEIGRVPEALCLHVGREVARGLAALHAAGLVHRDVKPENVLLTQEHVVKVMDLGIARGPAHDARMTETGMFVGSVQYAAPEQFGVRKHDLPRSAARPSQGAQGAQGDAIDPRADLWALGVTLYELSTGVLPFDAEDVPSTLRRVLHETPRRAGDANPQLSPFFEEVLRTLLEKDRDRRFASATELLGVLSLGEEAPWWRERARSLRSATRRPLRRFRIPRETAVYGRESELARLRAHFDAANSGDGRVILVEGEAGIGKSRLVDEFVGALRRDGEDVNFLFGSYPPGGAATASGAFSTAYREHFGAEDLEEALRAALSETPLLVPAFAALLRGAVPPTGELSLTKDALQTVFVHATRWLAAERPTIVLIDDLHFAPEEGRALFTALALAVPGHRVLLVGTARPGIDGKWLAQLDRVGVERMPLARLGPKDLVRLLADSLQSESLAEELSGKIAVKSDGNPFFVFEILRGLREGQFLTKRPDGSWATTRVLAEIEIPSSVIDLVNARVADLDREDRDLLDVASCLGFEFDPLLVGEVVGEPRFPLLKRLAQIERAHRLVRAAGPRYVFDHHQVQEALHRSLSEPLRAEYHAAIGDALERRSGAAGTDPKDLDGALCTDLAEHFLRGTEAPRALRYLDAALTHLEGACLHESAAELAGRALSFRGFVTGRDRVLLLLRRASRFEMLGRNEDEETVHSEALALADASADEALRATLRLRIGWRLLRVGRLADAANTLREALELARRAGHAGVESGAHNNLSLALLDLGRPAEALEDLQRTLELERRMGRRPDEGLALGHIGLALHDLGRFAEALEHHRSAGRIAREIGDRVMQANVLGNEGLVLRFLGRLEEARDCIERHLDIFRAIGYRRGEALGLGNLGYILEDMGFLAEARDLLLRQAALARQIGQPRTEALATGNLGVVLHRLGRLSDARASHEESLRSRREMGDRFLEGYTLSRLADLADDEGDPAGALAQYAAALAILRDVRHDADVADTLVQVADLRRRTGDPGAARAALDESVALFRAQGRGRDLALALAVAALLPGGDAAPALAAADEAGAQGGSPRVRFLLWQATGGRAHLAEAKRRLDHLVANAPEDCRETMVRSVPLHREIAEAARTAGL